MQFRPCPFYIVAYNAIASDTETPERSFSFEGHQYTIDLCDKDQRGLDKAISGLEPYAETGHRTTTGRARKPAGAKRGRRASSSSSADVPAIRAWAKAKGFTVSDRGRIAAEVQEAYAKASR
jgi:hypothetical protein